MKVLIINSVCGTGSTGRIAVAQAEQYLAQGHECKIAFGRAAAPKQYEALSYRIGGDLQVRANALQARLLDSEGFAAKGAMARFLRWAEEYDPDVLWLHNLHGYYLNVQMLFAWIKSRPEMQVWWFLHDCWAFTGHCAHFAMVGCEKWKTGCGQCPQKHGYPASWLADGSSRNFIRKKNAFLGVENMRLVVPSRWLARRVGESFLGVYPVEVCPHTVDGGVFRPTPSDFRKKWGLGDRKIILGVAGIWTKAKGLGDFIWLSRRLDASYAIVLVGISGAQARQLPRSILALPPVTDQRELAAIYTAADLFVNPSREESFGLTTLEAHACGTPVLVYRHTACQEVAEAWGGMAAEQNVEALEAAIRRFFET